MTWTRRIVGTLALAYTLLKIGELPEVRTFEQHNGGAYCERWPAVVANFKSHVMDQFSLELVALLRLKEHMRMVGFVELDNLGSHEPTRRAVFLINRVMARMFDVRQHVVHTRRVYLDAEPNEMCASAVNHDALSRDIAAVSVDLFGQQKSEADAALSPMLDLYTPSSTFAYSSSDAGREFMTVLMAIYHIFMRMRLVNYQGDVYEQVYTPVRAPGDVAHFTHCYEKKCEVTDFIVRTCNTVERPELLDALAPWTKRIEHVTEHIKKTPDPHFPMIKRDRHVFAFRDGIFCAERMQFWTYARDRDRMPRGVTACNYHDYAFAPGWATYQELRAKHKLLPPAADGDNPIGTVAGEGEGEDDDDDTMARAYMHLHRDMACAPLDETFERQLHGSDDMPDPAVDAAAFAAEAVAVLFWNSAITGRMFFDRLKLDRWGLAIFYYGIAQTGKSDSINLIAGTYASEDVGVVDNRIEETFGMYPLSDAFIIVAPELKKDCRIPQAQWQMWQTDPHVQLAIKHKNSVKIRPVSHWAQSGNQTEAWQDNAGSVVRRKFTFIFWKPFEEYERIDTLLEVFAANGVPNDLPLGTSPVDAVRSPIGNFVFAAASGTGEIVVMDAPNSSTLIPRVPNVMIGTSISDILITPDGMRMYALDPLGQGIVPIQVAENGDLTVLGSVPAGLLPTEAVLALRYE